MKNEGMTTSRVEDQTKRLPSMTWLILAVGSMAVSAGLALSGRLKAATFIGEWVPSLLIIGVYNKIAKTFSAPYLYNDDDDAAIRQGSSASPLKSQQDYARQTNPSRPLST